MLGLTLAEWKDNTFAYKLFLSFLSNEKIKTVSSDESIILGFKKATD